MDTNFIKQNKIYDYLKNAKPPDVSELHDIFAHARELKGLNFLEAERLLMITGEKELDLLAETASYVKNEIYGERLVIFAPLYISNLCSNECLYCAFRKSNRFITRRTLSLEEIKKETESLISEGHKRVLLVSGEGLGEKALDYTIKAIDAIYATKTTNGEIRRINVNTAPMSIEGFKRLKASGIGTYQLFQETYHYQTFKKMHTAGPKSDYLYHLTAMDRAMAAGIDDVGIGILFGLYDYRFEVIALLQHIRHLEDKFGVGCHTISVPRIESAKGSEISEKPPVKITDQDFKKILAVLRITVPYTGIILSTREKAEIRRQAFSLGISQVSAGSRTNPGGYSADESTPQFSLGDHRSLEEVINDMIHYGYIPSFCTGCYRLGRSGEDFMDLAKPGLIKRYCLPNALTSFKEYLINFASGKTRSEGLGLIKKMIEDIPEKKTREITVHNLKKIEKGNKDIYI